MPHKCLDRYQTMWLSSIILISLYLANVGGSVVDKQSIKSRLVQKLGEKGVVINAECEFSVKTRKFNTSIAIEKPVATDIPEEIQLRHGHVSMRLNELYEAQDSSQSYLEAIKQLREALVEFLETVLLQELQMTESLPKWTQKRADRALQHEKCPSEDDSQVDSLKNAIAEECGRGNLELDGNKICGSLVRLQRAINPINTCEERGSDLVSCLKATKPTSQRAINNEVEEMKATYPEAVAGLNNMFEMYEECVALTVSHTAADTKNSLHKFAECLQENSIQRKS